MPGSEPLNEKDFARMLQDAHSTCGCDDCFDRMTADIEALVAELRNTYALLGRPGLEIV